MRAAGRAIAGFVAGAFFGLGLAVWVVYLMTFYWPPANENPLAALAMVGVPLMLVGGSSLASFAILRESSGRSAETPIMIAATGFLVLIFGITMVGR